MAAAEADRLNDLPDDLLRRVLRFAPAKEGASTAVLSRRWRWLWRTSGAVNLDTRSYDRTHVSDRKAFLRHAAAALSAHGAHVARLSIHIEADNKYEIRNFVSPQGRYAEHNMISDVVSHTAARHVEALRIAAHCPPSNNHYRVVGFYTLRIAALPYEAVRVLHIVRAELELLGMINKSAAYYFPQLTTLLLQHCEVSLAELQDIMNGAPRLTTLRLESIFLLLGPDEEDDGGSGNRIRGPEVTTLVMTDWQGFDPTEDSIELDMPKLQYFTYAGLLSCQVSMKSQACNMTRVDFHFKDDTYGADSTLVPFWHFLRNFSDTRVLKLTLDCPIDHIAVDMKSLDKLLENKLLYNLERLEVQGCYNPANNVTGIAIANLLHCCPRVHDLRLKIVEESRGNVCPYPYVKCKIQQNFDKSVKNFRLRRGTSGGNDDIYEVSDIHGLSEHSFNCLQSCLRRVCLQFRNKEASFFFGIQLVKFFAENAMVLEEMHIDDGNHKMCEHVNDKVRIWALNAAKRRNGVSTKGFRVLPVTGERKIKREE